MIGTIGFNGPTTGRNFGEEESAAKVAVGIPSFQYATKGEVAPDHIDADLWPDAFKVRRRGAANDVALLTV